MIRPVLTDKSTRLMEMRQYTFEISPKIRKWQIKQQIWEMFQVKVLAIRRNRSNRAIVKLAESIDLLAYGTD
uniref:50S ribosomal protein L23 n=1 Tax=Cyanidiococcus yangmingshanensis TaxID=2690220 RepID=A0A7G5VUL5_9RHOD|nr:50S ribosomal protein L23 [Cyanidiococcus yangmingshanensis]QMX77382.1 50S ribosomal protein L23 [Cyanidiococcus yangmingshanensis]UNJ15997.1 ribosomal protein L23 [Cyanidioschyzonaceae sp. 3]WDB00512.1 ribosomal protein L23 [Cyanidiococcus yangmingshanensis]